VHGHFAGFLWEKPVQKLILSRSGTVTSRHFFLVWQSWRSSGREDSLSMLRRIVAQVRQVLLF